jgi:hypothetical protein
MIQYVNAGRTTLTVNVCPSCIDMLNHIREPGVVVTVIIVSYCRPAVLYDTMITVTTTPGSRIWFSISTQEGQTSTVRAHNGRIVALLSSYRIVSPNCERLSFLH